MTGSQSLKGWKWAIAAQERHYLPKCKQASLLRLLGVLDSHNPPEKELQRYSQKTEQQGKAISHSDCAHQTPELLGPGKGTKCRPNQIYTSEGFLSAQPERLRPGRCMKPRAGLRRFPRRNYVEPKWCAPRAGASPEWVRHCKHMPVIFVCSIPPSPQHD